ncbi:P-loop containing nucleoside triphosphate hydrolase [Pseudocohnilembus persalinus]|uniref:p-loop containing nucleoside triphosphate hydrolase n=1 Tax=Pseudocohnilembus persalinus TaxID=266149 RepID=A0A0V0QIV2_PSEPJ|nr:P-loop containing nucleoside triphosphate hydrolase [Pseudocohnilembus persalinus]|eukprot:KRX02173.1 P-loop containing nucleoside triphosphate hydrolase [Pseudocohnilembus persalinus]
MKMNFSEIQGLDTYIVKALQQVGYKQPSQIQKMSIPFGIIGNNIIAQSKAGTGKTVQLNDKNLEQNQRQFKEQEIDEYKQKSDKFLALIILPTRELSLQIFEVLNKILVELQKQKIKLNIKLRAGVFIGGLPIEDDRKNLKANTFTIAIGTLGRIQALIKEKSLNIKNIRVLILDEVDKLMQNKKSTQEVIKIMDNFQAEQDIQALFYSATYPQHQMNQIQNILKQYFGKRQVKKIFDEDQTDPGEEGLDDLQKQIKNQQKNEQLIQIVQYIKNTSDQFKSIFKLKTEKIVEILEKIKFQQCFIFYNDKVRGENLYYDLKQENHSPIFIHGDQSQADRMRTMNQLKRKKVNIIISTDLLSRGIDISSIDLVINFDAPNNIETYFHRIGRTARYGRFGVSLFLISEKEEKFLENNRDVLNNLQNKLDYDYINQKFKEKLDSQNQEKEFQTTAQKFTYYQPQISEWKDASEQFYDESKFKYYTKEEQTKEEEDETLQKEIQEYYKEFIEEIDNQVEEEFQIQNLNLSSSSHPNDLNQQFLDMPYKLFDKNDYNNQILTKQQQQSLKKQTQINSKLMMPKIESNSIQQNKNKNQNNHNHKQNQNDGLEFLNCQKCFDFLKQTQTILNREFKILDYFNLNQE